MAYDLKYLTRVQQTPNLDKSSNPPGGLDSITGPAEWRYDARASAANDTKAAVVAADYFLSAYGYLSVGDTIYAACTDGAHLVYVATSSSGGVTVTSMANA
jgi:hypothetical protein